MKAKLLTLVTIGVVLIVSGTVNPATLPAPSLSDYFEALSATTHGETTTADIDAVLEYYSEDIIYEHPDIGIHLSGKLAQETGMKAFVDSYAGTAEDSKIEILNYLKGQNMVAFNITVTFLHINDGAIEKVNRNQTRVVEIRNGKIARIIDYW